MSFPDVHTLFGASREGYRYQGLCQFCERYYIFFMKRPYYNFAESSVLLRTTDLFMIIRIIFIASVIVCRLYENTPWSGCKECAGQMGANGCDIQGYGQAAHIPFTIEGQCEISSGYHNYSLLTNLAKKGLSIATALPFMLETCLSFFIKNSRDVFHKPLCLWQHFYYMIIHIIMKKMVDKVSQLIYLHGCSFLSHSQQRIRTCNFYIGATCPLHERSLR